MKLINKITVSFIVFLSISILVEMAPDFITGDWVCNGNKFKEVKGHYRDGSIKYEDVYIGCTYGSDFVGMHQSKEHYGFRHWAIIFFGLFIFILRLVQIFEHENKKKARS